MCKTFMKGMLLLFAILFCCLPQNSIHAQAVLQFTNFDEDDGLVHSAIVSTNRDKHGYVWASMQGGLSRFDGKGWKSFSGRAGEEGTLFDNYVFNSALAPNGNLWVSTQNGIAVLDYQSMKQIDTLDTIGISAQLASDHYVIWERSLHVLILDAQGTVLHRFKPENETAFSRFNSRIRLIDDKNFWFVEESYLRWISVLDAQAKSVKEHRYGWPSGFDRNHLIGYLDASTAILKRGNVLYLMELKDSEQTKINSIVSSNELWELDVLQSPGLVMPDGSFWVHAFGQLWYVQHMFDGTYELVSIKEEDRPGMSNPAKTINHIMMDELGLIWMSGNGSGISVLDTRQLVFKNLQWANLLGLSESNSNTWTLAWNHAADQLVLGTDEAAYHIKLSTSFRNLDAWDMLYPYVESIHEVPLPQNGSQIIEIFYKSGYFYLYRYRNAIYKYHAETGEINEVLNLPKNNIPRFYQSVSVADTVWWTGFKTFYRQNPDDSFDPVMNDSWKDSLNIFYGIDWDSVSRTIILSETNGVYRFNPKNDEFSAILPEQRKKAVFGISVVMNSWVYGDHVLIGSFGKGLLQWHEDKQRQFQLGSGLQNEFIYDIRRDANGYFWMPTNQGLHRSDSTLNDILVVNRKWGLWNEGGNQNGVFQDSSAWLGFGGDRGMFLLHPDHFQEVFASEPSPRFFELQWQDQNGDFHIVYDPGKESVRIPYDVRSASFFPQLSDLYPERYVLQYRRNEADPWTPIPRETGRISIAGWAPGAYTISIRYRNLLGTWKIMNTALDLELTIPFWKRRSTLLVLFLFGFAVVGFVSAQIVRTSYQIRMRRLQERYRERELLSRDLHDSIGTQLSLIMHHLNGADKPDESKLIGKVESAREIARSSIDQLRETLWALKTETATISSFSKRVEMLAEKILRGTGIKLNFKLELENDYELGPILTIQVMRVVEESLTNAVKYSGSDTLTITLKSDMAGWEIEIRDFGVGFDCTSSQHKESYGLKHMRQRAEKMKAQYEFDTKPGQGTRIKLAFSSENLSEL